MSNCVSKMKKEAVFGAPTPSSLHTLRLRSTYDPNGPADRNPEGKGVAIKYNNYDRYLNRIRSCCEKNNDTLYVSPYES